MDSSLDFSSDLLNGFLGRFLVRSHDWIYCLDSSVDLSSDFMTGFTDWVPHWIFLGFTEWIPGGYLSGFTSCIPRWISRPIYSMDSSSDLLNGFLTEFLVRFTEWIYR